MTAPIIGDTQTPRNDSPPSLMRNRFLTFNTVVRVNQIEATRDLNLGEDEAHRHSLERVQAMRQAFGEGFPDGRMTWALSWRAIHDERPNYRAIRRQLVEYQHQFGDEITFIPGAYFANMHNTREQINRDIHEALDLIGEMVGGGYRPQSIVAGFLSAENQRFLAESENIHVCQGTIWSQYGIDNGDGDGSICYPYYPSREHFCKLAQNANDKVDCVNLDGWTCDFVSARRRGVGEGFNSRMGVGPIETVFNLGEEIGIREMMATTAAHFDAGFELNNFAWVTNCWEVCLTDDFSSLTRWLSEVRHRWPQTLCVTQGEFGMAWRRQNPDNSHLNYRFVSRGTGIYGSEENLEIRWFMNPDFRLALLRDWQNNGAERVIDFTRYDFAAHEPQDLGRDWSLLNRINQKQTRPQDKPIALEELTEEEQQLIAARYPKLLSSVTRVT